MSQKIRHASKHDFATIYKMLCEYRSCLPHNFLASADDEQHVTQLLSHLVAGQGVVLVAERDAELIGIFIAGIMPSLWSKKHLLLMEFAYFVAPAHRRGTAAYRLLAKYLQLAEAMKAEGRVTNFFISKMTNSPDLDYGRYGFQKLEEFWIK